jgi:hypothetical protein
VLLKQQQMVEALEKEGELLDLDAKQLLDEIDEQLAVTIQHTEPTCFRRGMRKAKKAVDETMHQVGHQVGQQVDSLRRASSFGDIAACLGQHDMVAEESVLRSPRSLPPQPVPPQSLPLDSLPKLEDAVKPHAASQAIGGTRV